MLVLCVDRLFGMAARQEQASLEFLSGHAGGRIDEDLLDVRQGLQRLLTAGRRIGGHQAPAGQIQPLRRQRRLDGAPCLIALSVLGREEHEAAGVVVGEDQAVFPGDGAQKRIGFLQQQAATIAGLAVGGYGAAMREPFQRRDGRAHQPVAGLVVHMGDQAEAAASFSNSGRYRPS